MYVCKQTFRITRASANISKSKSSYNAKSIFLSEEEYINRLPYLH